MSFEETGDGGRGPWGRAGRGGRGAAERADEVARVLELARRHLGSDVAWLSRFTGDTQVIDLIAGDGELVESLVGRQVRHQETYCARVLDGRLPAVIPDARADRRTADLPVTRELGIGSYVGAPVVLEGGEIYGMLCALSVEPDPGLGEREGRFLGLLANVVSDAVTALHRGGHDDEHLRAVIEDVIARGGPTMVFQPVFDLPTHGIVGAEALARFPAFPARAAPADPPAGVAPADAPAGAAAARALVPPEGTLSTGERSPDRWFADAATVGMGIELELAAIRSALRALPRFPRGLSLALNASPATIASGRLTGLLADTAADQVILEITEREGIHDLPGTLASLYELRDLGVRVAVDNVGVAYASLRRLVQILPDVVKMDRWLTMDVGADPARRALVGALVHFSRQIGACLVAKGIQCGDELRVLASAGVDQGQGEFLAPPGPLPLPAHGRCVAVERRTRVVTGVL